MPLHASLTPTMINLKDPANDTLTVSIDGIANADEIKIRIMERDLDKGDADDEIAVIEGALSDKVLTVSKPATPPSTGNRPVLKVKIANATNKIISFPIPVQEAAEGAIYEAYVEVTSKIAEDKKTKTKEKKEKYSTKSNASQWVMIHDYSNYFSTTRPVATFVTGTGAGFTWGEQFWRPRVDLLSHADNVAAVMKTVSDAPLAVAKDKPNQQGYDPWAEVNIIAHASRRYWGIKPRADSADNHIDADNFDALVRGISPPSSKALDAQSRIVLRSCVMGARDNPLLRKIFDAFGGRAPVYVPKYALYYAHTPTGDYEYFMEDFNVLTPGKSAGSAQACETALRAKYGPDPRYAKIDWRAFVESVMKAGNRVDRPMQTIDKKTIVFTGNYTTANKENENSRSIKERIWAEQRNKNPNFAEDYQSIDSWEWVLTKHDKKIRRTIKYSILGKSGTSNAGRPGQLTYQTTDTNTAALDPGMKSQVAKQFKDVGKASNWDWSVDSDKQELISGDVEFEVYAMYGQFRRELLDAKNKRVVPNVTNPEHFQKYP
jgi:hypothetical protein